MTPDVFEDLARLDRGLLRVRLVACAAVTVLLVAILVHNRSALLLLSSPEFFAQINAYWGYLQANMRTEPIVYGVLMVRFVGNLVTLGAFALAIVAIILGALRLVSRTLWDSLIHLRNVIPESAPEGFRDVGAVVSTATTRKIVVNHGYHDLLKAMFGAAAAFIAPSVRSHAENAASRLASLWGRIFGYVALAGLMLGGVYFLHLDEVLNSIFSPALAREISRLGAIEAAVSLSPPIILMLGLVALLAVLDFAFLRAVVPAKLPALDCEVMSDTLSASTDYRNIVNQLPNRAEARRYLNIPNRVVQIDVEAASAAISNSGSFEARLVIEQQPLPAGNPVAGAAHLRLVSGWGLYAAGMAIGGFMVLPAAIEQIFALGAVNTPSALLPPALALLYLLASQRFRKAGLAHIGAGEDLFEVQRFKSQFAFIRLRGTQHKAKVRVGKADTDSVETSTQVTHPEFLAEVWAATVESEAGGLDQPRELVTMTTTPASHQWLKGIFEDVRTLCQRRVDVVGINLQNPDLQDIVRGNVNISAHREGGVELARRQVILGGNAASPQIAADPMSLDGARQFCADCGTPASSAAQFCSNCGSRLNRAGA